MRDCWTIKIAAITFCLSMVVSCVSELASSASGIVVAGLIIFFLLMVSVLNDAIAVAVAACDEAYFAQLASRSPDNHSLKLAYSLVKNKERVNNICADVVGDVCSILSGACGATIAIELIRIFHADKLAMLVSIIISSMIAALTVGGKALVKSIAMKKSSEFIIYSAKILTILMPHKKLNRRK